jgi:BirA family biotin operon repressor/biotin-[acetyl-CoA-carboxylase] ligase
VKTLHLDKVDSTQSIAASFLNYNSVNEILILADVQTKGRGRLNERSWISVNENFHGSFVISLEKLCISENSVSMLNDICLKIIKDFLDNEAVSIKTPNDVLIDGKKVAGVLIEVQKKHAIIGIGINVKHSPLPTSTSILQSFKRDVSLKEIAQFISDRILSISFV